ncbi:MAG TPA: excinuclease ABC subunit UvrA [Steroidobacteraceae bacterium]|jgi:excinuclease ABC subunit A|nr:excinuclease ABC subunit UvrA [Steroidobacteraceae bacterium]
MQHIHVRGARTHNLKNLSLDLPRERLIVVTGLSGSGKSSLTFDTLYAEGQRRYVESLSAYARQFLATMDKPDVDSIEGLSPAIAIEQKAGSHNPRSTVGTVTEIYDYLRLLYARAGLPRCPDHGIELTAQTVSQMVDQALKLPEGTAAALLAPVVSARKGEHHQLFEDLAAQGFVRVRVDGRICELDARPELDGRRPHTIEAVVDRVRIRAGAAQRLAESFETALRLSGGIARLVLLDEPERDSEPRQDAQRELTFSSRHACPVCGYSVPPLEPKLFSFNNPAGACPACDGLGVQEFFDPQRVVLHPQLSLAGGAVRGWDRRNEHYFQLIQSLSKHYGFDIETPWTELPAHVQQLLLEGSGTESIGFSYREGGRRTRKRHPFEGILPNLTRRYRETESPMVREELARYLSIRPCPECQGTRLSRAARFVFIAERSLPEVAHLTVGRALEFLESLSLPGWRGEVAAKVVKGMVQRLRFLCDVGLEYLTLDRNAETLSGGESQRIRLASQVGSGLTGVMYILDEPSIGLHQRDNRRLLATLKRLRDLGNTVIVVEHDEEAIREADHVVDLGPGAGAHGGELVAQGTPRDIEAHPASITGQYLSGRRRIEVPDLRPRPDPGRLLRIVGARGNNLRNITAEIPLGLFTCVTGVSGSGKSTLIVDTLFGHTAARLNGVRVDAAPCERIDGLEHIDRVIDIDQSPIGRTPRSNPATYTGLFAPLRELFAQVPEARARGYDGGRFSFNVKGGRCEACQGDGVIRVEMHFLPDVYVPCDVCKGQRYNRETLEIRYRGKNIHEVLEMTVEEALRFFQNVPAVAAKLHTLADVGLAYVRLGQNATTLSGGEAQRVKLSRELAKRATGRTLYILDEPTTGLHFHDVAQLLAVLHRLRDEGNTIVVIEHNLDVIKTADWVIDLGPEGGEGGGEVIVSGTPEAVAACERSFTGRYLRPLLERDERRRAVGA